jgi:hypothetical protein
VESPTSCVQQRFSDQRVVPAYKQDQKVDWRKWNIVRPAYDLSQRFKCGAGDYAISTVAAAESAYAIKTGYLYDVSKQFVIDCDVVSRGCEGGF